MAKCSNCGLESRYLYGPTADLCNDCNNMLGTITNPQTSKEEYEQNKKKRGDT